MSNNTQLTRKEQNQTASKTDDKMLAIIERVALDPAADVNKLKEMLAMQEHIFDKNAQLEFNNAMTACQQEMPSVLKESENSQTRSKYAKLDLIIKVCAPIWTKHGFALSFGTAKSDLDGHIGITCVVSHVGGFSRDYRWDLPLDDKGAKGTKNKTMIHASGSTVSYGRRYLTCMIFNIAVQDDDDGTAGNSIRFISDEQAADLNSLVNEVLTDQQSRGRFYGFLKSTYGANSVAELRENDFDSVVARIEQKRKS